MTKAKIITLLISWAFAIITAYIAIWKNLEGEITLRIIFGIFFGFVMYLITTVSIYQKDVSDLSYEIKEIRTGIEKINARIMSHGDTRGATYSFNELYEVMTSSLQTAKKEIMVSSYIGKDPEGHSDYQREYHSTFEEKIKDKNLVNVTRIIAVPNPDKLKWLEKNIETFGNKPEYSHFTIYYDRKSSDAKYGSIMPLNIQIYDDHICIINPSCIKNKRIDNKKCIHIRSKEIAESFSHYYEMIIKQFDENDWLIQNGKVNTPLVNEIREKWAKYSTEEI